MLVNWDYNVSFFLGICYKCSVSGYNGERLEEKELFLLFLELFIVLENLYNVLWKKLFGIFYFYEDDERRF